MQKCGKSLTVEWIRAVRAGVHEYTYSIVCCLITKRAEPPLMTVWDRQSPRAHFIYTLYFRRHPGKLSGY